MSSSCDMEGFISFVCPCNSSDVHDSDEGEFAFCRSMVSCTVRLVICCPSISWNGMVSVMVLSSSPVSGLMEFMPITGGLELLVVERVLVNKFPNKSLLLDSSTVVSGIVVSSQLRPLLLYDVDFYLSNLYAVFGMVKKWSGINGMIFPKS